jgi:hypothetical protein
MKVAINQNAMIYFRGVLSQRALSVQPDYQLDLSFAVTFWSIFYTLIAEAYRRARHQLAQSCEDNQSYG